jgi:hypothetical protein
MSVRKEHLMLTLIVPRKHQVKNMDVYIAPFIDEMQTLWKGIRMYHISCPPSNRSFMLYGVLCWTVHDFLELGVCSGKIKYLHIHTHNLSSSQHSYLLLYYYYNAIFVLTEINGLSHERKYTAMWAYERHCRVESVDVKRGYFDCGIMVDFKQSS